MRKIVGRSTNNIMLSRIVPIGSKTNSLGKTSVLSQLRKSGGEIRQAVSEKEARNKMAECLSGILGNDRTLFYALDSSGLLTAGGHNEMTVFQDTHFKGLLPEGPIALAIQKQAYVYVPDITDPGDYLALDEDGYFNVDGSSFFSPNKEVVRRYLKQYGVNFGAQQPMDMAFGFLSDGERVVGGFRLDSFLSGRSLLPKDRSPEDLLDIIAIAGSFASESLASFRRVMEVDMQRREVVRVLDQATKLSGLAQHVYGSRVTAARGFLELMLVSPKPDIGWIPGILRMLDDAVEAGRDLLEPVVDGTLNLSINIVETKIADVLRSVNFPNLEIDIEDDIPLILTDPDKIRSIVFELLNNAAKHSPDGSKKILSCRCAEGKIVISVIDFGNGIKKELLSKIFDAYVKGEDVKGKDGKKGFGLGLYIFRELAEMLGGELVAESEGLGHGSTFTLTFPLS